jgi:hypothetical protein
MDIIDSKLQQIARAESLEDVDRTLSLQPLVTPEEIQAFYRNQLNETRGGDDIVGHLQLGLTKAYQRSTYFKACVMGHPGVGKSTELSRLVQNVGEKFRTIRFSAVSELDPVNFRPLDVLLIMMIEVAQQTAKVVEPPSARLQEIWDWFAQDKDTRERVTSTTAQIEAGTGVKGDSLWAKVSLLFANLRGELKFAATRKTEVVEYRLSRLNDLIEIANRLLDDCNRLLRDADRQEWLFIGEDFDKTSVPTARVEELFLAYSHIFRDLRTHLIFTVPIGLYYSDKAAQLQFEKNCSLIIPDTPVYGQDHSPNESGRAAIQAVLEARMNLDLFEPGQMLQLVVASGGNLRDLFGMVNYAAVSALLRPTNNDKISAVDVNRSLVKYRSDYERQLGQSPFDRQTITYSEKAALLERIYMGEKVAQVPDPVLYSLLSARAVQEFNGQRWFGVHPLVVDILAEQKKLNPSVDGGVVNGGTQLE